MAEPYDTSADHIAAELAWLDLLLRRAVAAWRGQAGAGPAPDVLRGLYVSDQEVDRLLVRGADAPGEPTRDDGALALRREVDARVAASEQARVPLALPQLARAFQLTPFESSVVLLALAPEVDLAYERLFAYLQDDLSRKRPTVDLALRLLCRGREGRVAALRALGPTAPLFRLGVLRRAHEAGAPLPATPLAVDGLTLSYLLHAGTDGWDPGLRLTDLRTDRPLDAMHLPETFVRRLPALVDDHVRRAPAARGRLVCHLQGPEGCGRKTLAAGVCREAGVPLVGVDVRETVLRAADPEAALRDVFRAAIFLQSAVYLDNADALAGDDRQAPLPVALARAVDEFSWLTFLATAAPWHHVNLFGRHTLVSLEFPRPTAETRLAVWQELASEPGLQTVGVSWGDLADRFRLTPGAMAAALRGARGLASLRGDGPAVTPDDLTRACYAQSNRRIGALARKLRLRRGWSDLTLPRGAVEQLREICAHVRHRRRVGEGWGFNRRIPTADSLCALFYGVSGAGKTMAVEVLALELQMEVYKIDLSTVVSKYIGETEKNLSRVFEEAESSNAILFFDEADALFGKRSEVKDAHDRYANIEINYLLQRIEVFEGLVVLATNLRKNIDEAFLRRIQFAVEFPMPDAAHRYRIWHQHFPEAAPVGDDVDIGFLAGRFPLAGGNIRNIVLNAAYLAAGNGGEIRMEHLIRATRREYDKTGRVCTETEFAPYQAFLAEAPDGHD